MDYSNLTINYMVVRLLKYIIYQCLERSIVMKNEVFKNGEIYGTENVIDAEYKEIKPANYPLAGDTNRVVLMVLVIDCSGSMSLKGILKKMPSYMNTFINVINNDSELRAQGELLVVKYGSNVEVDTFEPVRFVEEVSDFRDMGGTSTAEALMEAHRIVRERIHFYHTEVLRELPPPVIFHISDGMTTSTPEEMAKMVDIFDKCKRSDGDRRIKIWSVSDDDEAVEEMKKYSDLTFKISDMNTVTDMMRTYGALSSALSHSTMEVNPLTGEETFHLEDDLTLPDDVENVLPRDFLQQFI